MVQIVLDSCATPRDSDAPLALQCLERIEAELLQQTDVADFRALGLAAATFTQFLASNEECSRAVSKLLPQSASALDALLESEVKPMLQRLMASQGGAETCAIAAVRRHFALPQAAVPKLQQLCRGLRSVASSGREAGAATVLVAAELPFDVELERRAECTLDPLAVADQDFIQLLCNAPFLTDLMIWLDWQHTFGGDRDSFATHLKHIPIPQLLANGVALLETEHGVFVRIPCNVASAAEFGEQLELAQPGRAALNLVAAVCRRPHSSPFDAAEFQQQYILFLKQHAPGSACEFAHAALFQLPHALRLHVGFKIFIEPLTAAFSFDEVRVLLPRQTRSVAETAFYAAVGKARNIPDWAQLNVLRVARPDTSNDSNLKAVVVAKPAASAASVHTDAQHCDSNRDDLLVRAVAAQPVAILPAPVDQHTDARPAIPQVAAELFAKIHRDFGVIIDEQGTLLRCSLGLTCVKAIDSPWRSRMSSGCCMARCSGQCGRSARSYMEVRRLYIAAITHGCCRRRPLYHGTGFAKQPAPQHMTALQCKMPTTTATMMGSFPHSRSTSTRTESR